jgi:recombination protein RecA
LPGLQARLMSQALRKLTGTIHRTMATVVFLNQIRMKIGVMYGNPETTTGGNALKFYASVRLDIRRVGALKEGAEIVGNRTRVKVVKNKVSPPFKEVEVDLIYGQGLSRGEERIGQGREAVKAYFLEHPDTAALVEQKILAHFGVQRGGPAVAPAVPDDTPQEAPATNGRMRSRG